MTDPTRISDDQHNNAPAPAPAQGEPFGYFRAEPFGWTDCSEDAEGAIALYERPAAPAVPEGEPEAYMVYGNYTRQPFRSIESAQAYIGGLLKSDPEGGYHIRPLFYATPAAPSQEPAVPQGEPLTIQEQQKEWADYFNRCDSYDLPDRRHAFLAGLSRGRKIAAAPATPATAPAVPQGWPFGELSDGQIMATVGRMGELVNYLKLGQQWDGICNLVRQIIRERYTLAATPAPAPAQDFDLTYEEIEAIAQKHMSTVGDHWSNEEAIRERHAEDFARAIISALRAKGGK